MCGLADATPCLLWHNPWGVKTHIQSAHPFHHYFLIYSPDHAKLYSSGWTLSYGTRGMSGRVLKDIFIWQPNHTTIFVALLPDHAELCTSWRSITPWLSGIIHWSMQKHNQNWFQSVIAFIGCVTFTRALWEGSGLHSRYLSLTNIRYYILTEQYGFTAWKTWSKTSCFPHSFKMCFF